MTIDELASLVYEDLNGLITSARGTDRGLEVVYECDHWRDHDSRVAFLLRCSEVVESTVTPRASDDLHWTDGHPVLHDHNSEHGMLYFSSRPANPHEVVGRLYQAHETFYGGWREFREYANTCGDTVAILGNGSGVLATGPLSLLREYKEQLRVCSPPTSSRHHATSATMAITERCYSMIHLSCVANAKSRRLANSAFDLTVVMPTRIATTPDCHNDAIGA